MLVSHSVCLCVSESFSMVVCYSVSLCVIVSPYVWAMFILGKMVVIYGGDRPQQERMNDW